MENYWKKFVQWWIKASNRKRLSAILLIIAVLCTLLFLFFTYSFQSTTTTSSSSLDALDNPFYYFGVVAKTIGVLLFIIGGAIVVKRMQRKQNGFRSERSLSIVESIRMGPKQALHLVRVGEKYYLVGATDQNLNLISEVEPKETQLTNNQPVTINQQTFDTVLANVSGMENIDRGMIQ